VDLPFSFGLSTTAPYSGGQNLSLESLSVEWQIFSNCDLRILLPECGDSWLPKVNIKKQTRSRKQALMVVWDPIYKDPVPKSGKQTVVVCLFGNLRKSGKMEDGGMAER
jgi:hypothetical protein